VIIMPEEKKKVMEFDLEAIDTPAGKVPTITSVQRLTEALNALNDDMNEHRRLINEALISQMGTFEFELASLKKIISKYILKNEATALGAEKLRQEIISHDQKTMERFKKIEERMAAFEQNIQKKIISALDTFIRSFRSKS